LATKGPIITVYDGNSIGHFWEVGPWQLGVISNEFFIISGKRLVQQGVREGRPWRPSVHFYLLCSTSNWAALFFGIGRPCHLNGRIKYNDFTMESTHT